ncbi:hypothetical protein ACRYWZ_15660 [Agrobacterium deltaense]|uniref:hypothetical protein n=1 Tax=Agrobacterium deltaense TaxID=1183412 RepID=UPI003D97564C
MPRNGSGVYSKPAGTTAVPNTTIESAKFNQVVDDLVQDANFARPVNAGGTGGNSKQSGIDTLLDGATVISDTSLRVADPADRTKIVRLDAGRVTTGTVRVMNAPDRDINISSVPRGHISGLTLSNNATDAVNDIDIAPGEAADDSALPWCMVLSSVLTKRLDAVWAVGSGNGGRDTAAAIANDTYHVFLIQRSDTGVVDALFSLSATAPTMPANYDRKRRIGSIIRSSGSLRAFIQIGDYFWHSTRVQDVTAADPGSAAVTRTLTVPTGIPVIAFGKAAIVCTAASGANTRFLLLTSLSQPDADPNVIGGTIAITTPAVPSATGHRAQGDFTVPTNNNGQVRSRMNASDPAWVVSIITEGWIDTRIV